MTIKFNKVYLNNTSVVAGPYLIDGKLKGLFDDTYIDFYDGEKTFEDCEIKELKKSINILLNKEKIKKENINLMISSDLSNQLMISNFVARDINIPYFGVYNACSSFTEELIIASSMIDSNKLERVICTTSSNIMTSERQFRSPVEYGSPKPEYATFTVSSATACLISNKKSNIKIESATIGRVEDLNIKDGFDMGSAMTPSAARTLYEHLNELNRTIDYYDLILTGDLGIYGEKIFKEYCMTQYGIKLDNYNDTATLIYNKDDKDTLAGGSGPSCMPTYLFTKIISQMKDKKIKKVLLLATGALFSLTSVNQKKSIPSICHAVSLEAI